MLQAGYLIIIPTCRMRREHEDKDGAMGNGEERDVIQEDVMFCGTCQDVIYIVMDKYQDKSSLKFFSPLSPHPCFP